MIVREPNGPIQVSPAGLLGFLQLKVGGRQPDAMRQDVQPIVDLSPYWLRSGGRNVSAAYSVSVPAGLLGGIAPLVDAGTVALGPGPAEWWYVHSLTLSAFNNGAAATSSVGLGMVTLGGPGFATSQFMLQPESIDMGAAAQRFLGARDFWLPPSATLGVWVGTVGAATSLDVVLGGCWYTPLPI